MSSDDPLASATEGVTKGILDWTSEKVNDFIKKFRDKELAFIQDAKTIELVREQYNSGESKFYNLHIKDKNLLFLVKLGLVLRKIENDSDRQKNLREKIFRKSGILGLHIAEFVQNGILNRYLGLLIEEITSIENLQNHIEDILRNIEKYVLFVQANSNGFEILKKVNAIVLSHSPCIFIVSGFGNAAKLVSDITDLLADTMKDYNFERFSSGEKEILFFRRKLV